MGRRRTRDRLARDGRPSSDGTPAGTRAGDAPALHRAFHRMACLFANLVCGIWLVLLTTLWLLDPDRPVGGSLLLVLLVSAPIAYVIPYGLIRLAGLILRRRRSRAAQDAPPVGRERSGP